MNTILKIIFIFTLIFIVHEAGHAIIDGVDTNKGQMFGVRFTGHGLTEPGFYIYTIGDSMFGRISGFILSGVFVLACMRLSLLSHPERFYCILYVFWLARWDMIAVSQQYLYIL